MREANIPQCSAEEKACSTVVVKYIYILYACISVLTGLHTCVSAGAQAGPTYHSAQPRRRPSSSHWSLSTLNPKP